MNHRSGAPWLNYLLGILCVGAIVAAILVVGPASSKQTTVTRTAKATQGVVQSTVSGSGNLQASSQLNLGFKTSGTVTDIYVHQGEHVVTGQLIAALDPQSAEVTLEQAKANLQSAEANLAREEETDGETSTGEGQGSSAVAATASVRRESIAEISSSEPGPSTTESPTTNAPSSSPTTTPVTSTPTSESSSSSTTPEAGATPSPSSQKASGETNKHMTGKRTSEGSNSGASNSGSASKGSPSESSPSSSSSTARVSSATREANLASARASVKSAMLTVHSDEEAVANTKLYAPQDGTIVSLSGQVGEVVSGSGTTKASTSSGSSSESAASGIGAVGGSSSSRESSASSSGSSSSSSSAFAILSDLSSMRLVVALSESEIGNVKDGQIATVTVEALDGRKLAAHVSEVATLSTSDSGVVSYDVTFQLDQMETGLKPGMSATAEVVVKQAEGVNVPTSAISGGSVTVLNASKQERRPVTTGLAGNTSTIVSSGLKAGETVLLPVARSASTSSLSSRLASRLGGSALGGAGGGLGGGGFAGARFAGGAGLRGGGG